MYEWRKLIQTVVDEIDRCIQAHDDEALTLCALSRRLGYSEFYTTRKFSEIAGMPLREYLRQRKLAFALKEVRDSDKSLLDIALDHSFSSNEAFTRAFRQTYGVTPSAYRRQPRPVVLRTKIHPLDRYILGLGEIGMIKSQDGVKTYFVTIPAHKFLHIENRESNGYWDFWEKQSRVPGGPGRTARRSAACWTASRASWTTPAAAIPPACPGSSWPISTTPPAACATGGSCARSATGCAFWRTTGERYRRRCC